MTLTFQREQRKFKNTIHLKTLARNTFIVYQFNQISDKNLRWNLFVRRWGHLTFRKYRTTQN